MSLAQDTLFKLSYFLLFSKLLQLFPCLVAINFLLLPLTLFESLFLQEPSIFLYSRRKDAQFISNTAVSISFQ